MKGGKKSLQPWYAGEHQDAIFYLMIAIFFIELIIGGVAFFYGIIHARPETPGGPPLAQFPWFAWSLASILGPVGLLLVVHLSGTWVARAIMTEGKEDTNNSGEKEDLPPGMRRFYAAVRHAPTVVILIAILILGAALFFIDGAFATLGQLGSALAPYIPWLAGSLAALLAICFIAHAMLVYRQRKMENEYAWKREVLEKTGLVIVDKNHASLLPSSGYKALNATNNEPDIVDITPKSIGENEQSTK